MLGFRAHPNLHFCVFADTSASRDTSNISWRLASQQWVQGRRQRFQHLGGECAGEFVLACIFAMHVRDDRAEVAIAQEKHKRRGAVHGFRAHRASSYGERVVAMIAGAGFSADRDRRAVSGDKQTFEPARPAVLDDGEQRTA
jgi:hypothetical protein